MEYKQFCPVSKASEIIGERWALLIVRELLMGARRFSELQRGLAAISPTVLTRRLNELADDGLVLKKRIPGQRGFEYHLTLAGRELAPVIRTLGDWGMRWARGRLADSDLDVELLMLYLERSIRPENLIGGETVIHFHFRDLEHLKKWWLIVKGHEVDVCLDNPGREVDIRFDVDLRTMVEIWMGDLSYRSAIRSGRLKLSGPAALIRDVTAWMSNSPLQNAPPAAEIC